jgi:hypothetical protein
MGMDGGSYVFWTPHVNDVDRCAAGSTPLDRDKGKASPAPAGRPPHNTYINAGPVRLLPD